MTRCHLCGRTVFECAGWFQRINPKGEDGIWECRPLCGVKVTQDEALLGAIEAEETQH